LVRLLNCGISIGYDFLIPPVEFKSMVDEVISLCQQIGPQADVELCFALAHVLWDLEANHPNDKTAARRYCEQCLEVAQRLKPEDVWYKAWAYFAVGDIYSFMLEEHGLACQYALEGWRLFQQAGDRWLVGHLFILGNAAIAEGDYEKTRHCYQEAFSVFHEVDDLNGVMICLGLLAELEILQGDPGRARHAARLFGAVEALGYLPEKVTWKDRAGYIYPQTMNNLRRWLDPDELAVAWAEGASMSMDEVYEYVLEEKEPI
jgi:tetratricopeptide (TPR) repeat protein